MAPFDPSVPSEESDGISAVRSRRRRSDWADGENLPVVAQLGGRPARSHSTQPQARPLDRTSCVRVCWIGWTCPGPVRSGGHDGRPSDRAVVPAHCSIGWPLGRRLHGRPPCYIRSSAPLPLSFFFSPLQFTLEWIRSGFGWTKSIHWLLIFGRKKVIL